MKHAVNGSAILVIGCVTLFHGSNASVALPSREQTKRDQARPKSPISWNTRIPVEIRDKSWTWVLRWFAAETGLDLIIRGSIPNGTFTFDGPTRNGERTHFTLREVFDTINWTLVHKNKQILLRGHTSLTLISADDEENWPAIPRIRFEDLDLFNGTDLVEVVVNLGNNQDPQDVPGQLKKWLGEFGAAKHLANDAFLLRGTHAAIRLVLLPLSANESQ